MVETKVTKYENIIKESSRYDEINERDYIQSNSCPTSVIKKHNSCRFTLILNPEHSLGEVKHCYSLFMDGLIDWGGLKENKVSHSGYLFSRNSYGNWHPHIHGVIYSTKDAKTGRTVTRLSKATLERLQSYWKELIGWHDWKIRPAGSPFKSELIYDAQGVIDYLTGPHNMQAESQRWMRLPSHNLELLERKRIEKECMSRRAARSYSEKTDRLYRAVIDAPFPIQLLPDETLSPPKKNGST